MNTFVLMKHWLLGFVFLLIAIIAGMEAYKESLKLDKNWWIIAMLAIVCIVAFGFYFKERKKRNAHFKERMNNKKE